MTMKKTMKKCKAAGTLRASVKTSAFRKPEKPRVKKVKKVKPVAWGSLNKNNERVYPLHKGQTDALCATSRFTAAIAGTGGGKSLALDTVIPTPTGFSTVGEIAIGAKVFDEYGVPCTVISKSAIHLNHVCYEVTFDDGTKIVADEEHLWKLQDTACRANDAAPWDLQNRVQQVVLQTKEWVSDILVKGKKRYSVKNASIEGVEQELEISPYVLGVWLGDGVKSDSRFSTVDTEILTHIMACGVSIGTGVHDKRTKELYSYVLGAGEKENKVLAGLRKLNLLGNKHIPEKYLRASYAQRLALVQGLMDTDGCCEKLRGRCYFGQTNEALVRQMQSLLASLGIKSSVSFRIPKIGQKEYDRYFQLNFITSVPVFKLSRKVARLQEKQNATRYSRYICSCVKVESVPVQCIGVDSVAHTYLCTTNFIATHNTVLGPLWIMQRIETLRAQGVTSGLIGMVIAPTYKVLSRATVPTLLETFRGTKLEGRFLDTKGHYVLPNNLGILYLLSADSPDGLEGGQLNIGAWLDEAGQMSHKSWLALCRRTGVNQAPVFITTTPYMNNWLKTEVLDHAIQGDKNYTVASWSSILNPVYPREEYERAKRTLTKAAFDMMYNGLFTSLEGLVYPDLPNCVVDTALVQGRKVGGIDFGWRAPFVALSACLYVEDGKDILYVYDERYVKECPVTEHAKCMDKDTVWWCDPSAPGLITELCSNGLRALAAKNAILGGIEAVNARILTGRLKISSTCINLLAEASFYQYSQEEGCELPVGGLDHALDALRYLCLAVARRPLKKIKNCRVHTRRYNG